MARKQSPLTTALMDPDNNEYATPAEIWRPLSRAVDGFDLDPCSGAETTPIATDRYTVEDDGLVQPWYGDVFVNPPWATNGNASSKEKWLLKARNEASKGSVDTVTVLIPSDTSTHWFHDHVLAASSICFVGPGRVSFEGGDRNPSFGLIIAVYGSPPGELIDSMNTLGSVFDADSIIEPNQQTTLTSSQGVISDGGRTNQPGLAHFENGDSE